MEEKIDDPLGRRNGTYFIRRDCVRESKTRVEERMREGGKGCGCLPTATVSDTWRVRGRKKQRGLLMTRQTNRWLERECIRNREISGENVDLDVD